MSHKKPEVLVRISYGDAFYFIPEYLFEAADAIELPDGKLLALSKSGVGQSFTGDPASPRVISLAHN